MMRQPKNHEGLLHTQTEETVNREKCMIDS